MAGNARDHGLRGQVPPRFYVPGDQGMDGPNEWATFEIRTAGDPKLMLDTVRKNVVSVDANLYPTKEHLLVDSLENSMSPTANDCAALCRFWHGGIVAGRRRSVWGAFIWHCQTNQ